MKMFKSSVRGFKKSDVNNYIIDMHREFADIKNEYETEIAGLKAEVKKLSDELKIEKESSKLLSSYELKCTRLESELTDALSKVTENKAKIDEYIEKISYADDALSTLADRIVELENANTELRSALNDKENFSVPKTCKNPDSIRQDIQDITIEKAKKTEEVLKHITDNTVKDLNSVICEGANSFINDLRGYAEKLMFTSKSAAEGLASEYGQMAEKVLFYFDALENSTSQSISEFKIKSEALLGHLSDNNQNGES